MLNNQKEAAEIYDLITGLVSLGEHMSDAARRGERSTIAHCGQYMGQAIQALRAVSVRIDQEQPQITLNNFCRTIECSLLRILTFRRDYAMKCEFELLPVLQELRMYFYYWGCTFPDQKKMEQYRKKELKELASNRYIDKAEAEGHYKYDLTITIQSFNHLEDATKQCIFNLFTHLPGNLNYELVLVNNGSSDGTKEYFEQFCPTKQFDMALNYGGQMGNLRIYEGKYVLVISNDVFVLHHAIGNMLRCMDSDPDIAYLVPQTPNISNLQTLGIPYKCSSFTEEIVQYAIKNNCYDPHRHIQRSRLCNPLSMFRSVDFFSSKGSLFNGIFYAEQMAIAFMDDAISIMVNRMGKKNVLQKDAFCYHIGQLTVKDDISKEKEREFYRQGRLAFCKRFGVDPWGTGFCFDTHLIQAIEFAAKPHINILGINSGLGDNPLQIKECYKEYLHITDVTLYCAYQNEMAGRGMEGVADVHILLQSPEELKTVFAGVTFDHIVMEDPFSKQLNFQWMLNILCSRLHSDGSFALRLTEPDAAIAQKKYPKLKYQKGDSGIWVIGGAHDIL